MDVVYKSHGIPLEQYQLTRRDHQWQRTFQQIDEHAEREAAKASPLSDETIERLAVLLSYRTPETELMRWRIRLYCGHITETRRHCEMERPTDHGSSGQRCPECGMDPAAIVAYEPLGLVAKPAHAHVRGSPGRSSAPTKAELRAENAQLRAEIARLQAQLRERCGGSSPTT